ncbi:hypothetical protein DPSP01_003758 [Paraphaeosphaeria sporulosa]
MNSLLTVTSIAFNPTLRFVVIVNPNSGPGSEPWWPNADYLRDVPKLNACSNVRTVGYVSTAYCNRPIQEVYEDIRQYASWAKDKNSRSLGMNGIFFDETPNIFTENARNYLTAITQNVKNMGTLLGDGINGAQICIMALAQAGKPSLRQWQGIEPLESSRTLTPNLEFTRLSRDHATYN